MGGQSGQREVTLLPALGIGWAQEGCEGSALAQAPPWAQHERAFNELSENFLLFYKNAKINKANLLEIKYELAVVLVYMGVWVPKHGPPNTGLQTARQQDPCFRHGTASAHILRSGKAVAEAQGPSRPKESLQLECPVTQACWDHFKVTFSLGC